MIYSKIFKFVFACISFAVLSACNSKDEEAKKLGFSSAEEMNEIHAQGWHTKNRYEEDTAKRYGYSSVSEWKTAEEKIKIQQDFEKNWKENGKHIVAVGCVAPGHKYAEPAIKSLLDYDQETFKYTVKIGYSEFCVANPISFKGVKWPFKEGHAIKVIGKKDHKIYWYTEGSDGNVYAGLGGYTTYEK